MKILKTSLMIGPGSTKLRRVEFWLAPQEWLVTYNTSTTVLRVMYLQMKNDLSRSKLSKVTDRQTHRQM